MPHKLSLIVFMAVIAGGLASTTTMATTREPMTTTTEKPVADNPMKSLDRRDKRQLTANGGQTSLAGSSGTFPIFFDGVNVNPPLQTLQPLPPLQQLQPLQPITVVTPVASSSNAQSQQPQAGWLPGFGQNLPIIGTWVGGLPNLISGLGLGGLNGGFGTLGGLNLGNLGLGAVAPVAPAAGQTGGSSPNPQTSCPLTQKLSCRCEPLIQLPGLKPSSSPLRSQLVQILRQNARKNDDGSQEMRVILSSGHVLYQRTARDRGQTGYLAMRIQSGRYFNIYYSVNEKEYTVRADVKDAPPTSDFDDELSGQL
ncbi:uncharacterized protein LOC108032953 [Drosophila biarmipes]|uniref:uncharacterized protein LOC108032953 n=1 Tax=Drosophila biarmipes TaxID=125945 RepID=UPI0007E72713|nr:uncharacterized protein LOC108032953 [Drosophila biarmipes]